tara:strand:- start:1976 stop:2488 length:513 start_codon:yes stop_codon:yes gene_type:complete
MITYNEAFDINHTIYRILLLLHSLKFDSVEFERLRIWDFYMAFPYEIGNVRFGVKPEDRTIKKLFPKKINPYRKITNPRKLYSRMQPYQLTAINKLASYGIIANDHDSVGRVKVVDRHKLIEILENIGIELDSRQSNVMKILTTYFYHMDFYGEGGLKARTKLSEYHYDE